MMPNGAPTGALVFDCTVAEFEQKVIMASLERPVIVDFWAPWCGPCKQLGPLLEKAVLDAKGAVLMAKVDIDKNQEIAAALRVQSIPTVYAFFGGRPVDGFQGALPESQIKAFVDKISKLAKAAAPNALDIPKTLTQAAEALALNNLPAAQQLYIHILQQDEKNTSAYVGLIRTYIAAKQINQAMGMIDSAPPEISTHASFSEAKTALELAMMAPQTPRDALLRAHTQSPNDPQIAYDLAVAQFADGDKAAAIELLLSLIKTHRTWNEGAARTFLIKIFEALGSADPLVIDARRRLSTLLFS
jgi:putative thioredoxin